jgi:hypothetical protein
MTRVNQYIDESHVSVSGIRTGNATPCTSDRNRLNASEKLQNTRTPVLNMDPDPAKRLHGHESGAVRSTTNDGRDLRGSSQCGAMGELFWAEALARVNRVAPYKGPFHVSKRVQFAEQPIIATIALSAYTLQEGQLFQSWRRGDANCWIQTPHTPSGAYTAQGDPSTDQMVRLRTSWLWFYLEGADVWAAAVGSVYRDTYQPQQGGGSVVLPPGGPPIPPESAEGGGGETRGAPIPPPEGGETARPINVVDFLVVDKKGNPVGYHQEIQLEGGASIIADQVVQLLAQREYRGVKGPVRARVVERPAR